MPKVGDVGTRILRSKYFRRERPEGREVERLSRQEKRCGGVLHLRLHRWVNQANAGLPAKPENAGSWPDTQVLGVSMDSAFANKAFADQIGVTFPLLSDWGGKVNPQVRNLQRRIPGTAPRELPDRQRRKDYGRAGGQDAIDPAKIVDACGIFRS